MNGGWRRSAAAARRPERAFHETIIPLRYGARLVRASAGTTARDPTIATERKEKAMTKEQRIHQYYRTGLWCFHAGRRADAALMLAAIRSQDPAHPLAARLRAALARGQEDARRADDAELWEDAAEACAQRSFVRWRTPPG